MRAPSAKTLLSEFKQLTPEDARLIRSIAGAADDGDELKALIDARVPATANYVRSLYSDPYRSRLWRNTVALHAMNEVLGTHGVEGLGPPRGGDYAPPYEYLNAGDTYVGTLIYDRDRDRLFVGSWGDVVEKHPEWEASEDHATIKTMPMRGNKSRAQLDREIANVVPSWRGGR
jgi:hypothetical protein